MPDYPNPNGRKPGDYILFAVAFVGFVIAVAGIEVSSPSTTLTGAIVCLLALLGFVPRRMSED